MPTSGLASNIRTLARILEGSGAFVSFKDLDGRYLYIDSHHKKLLPEATGKTDFEIFPAECAEQLRAHDQETLAAGTVRSFPEELHFPDGGRSVISIRFPVRDAAGAPAGLLTISTGSAASADEGWQRYRTLLESTSDIVTVLDTGGIVRYVTPSVERVLGYTVEERIGVSTFELIHPDDLPMVRRTFVEGASGGATSGKAEARFRRKDGSWCVLEAAARNLLDVPSVQGIVVTSRDITEHTRVEAALRDSEAALLRSGQELQRLTASLFKAQEEERARISRELHDDLNQKLALLAVEVETLESDLPAAAEGLRQRFQALRERTGKLCDDVRRIAYQLHPSVLEHLGLVAALRSYVSDLQELEAISVRFTPQDVIEPLPPEVALCLYRVAQEALRNVSRHSGSKEASVSLRQTAREIRLTISDRGAGFEAEAASSKGGLGLVSIRERVRASGGSLAVQSRPGGGTRIEVAIPLAEQPL